MATNDKTPSRPISVTGSIGGDVKPSDPEQVERDRKRSLINLAGRQFRSLLDASRTLPRHILDPRRFAVGQIAERKFQWPEEIQEQRAKDQRPCEQVNRIPGFI